MELNERVEQLEHEMTILKNEIQAVLLDLRESYLARENPFDSGSSTATVHSPPLDEASEETDLKGSESAEDSSTDDQENDCDNPEVVIEEVAQEKDRSRSEEASNLWQTASESKSLTMITALTHWVEESTRQLGQEGAKAIVEVSELMGNMPPDIKSILLKLISLRPSEPSGETTTRTQLSCLVKLTELLGKCNKAEATLLSLLLEQKENG